MPFLAPVVGSIFSGGFITQLLLGTALSLVGSLLSGAAQPPAQSYKDPGVSLQVQVGSNNPLSFFIGTGATAGHRIYAGSFGQEGETPNAYYADVLEISNVPIDGLSGYYANGERSVILFDQPHSEFGYPILQGRRDGVDHLWVKFYDGRQTVADPYLLSRFGAHPERPYGTDMVGRGTAYAVVTSRYHRELWQGRPPTSLFEVRGIRCYDMRKDSTAGGSGAHRRNDPATWEWSQNPYVIAYNVAFMGVYWGSEWVWGMQNLPAMRLPASAWIAAMNEADRVMPAWNNQVQFTVGGEITVDMQPADVLTDLAKSSMGRIIESAGSYKPRCGLPGAAVWNFGEGEMSITDPRSYTPYPGLEGTHNVVEVTYSEPLESWGARPAPSAVSLAYKASDGNRELKIGLNLAWVNRNEQAQRLAYTYLHDGRRFRTLQASFHPITWALEPGDVIDGTIVNEGYVDKSFEILEMSGRRDFMQTMVLREVDPSDFDPPASAYKPWTVGPIQTLYPPTQPATGISFDDYVLYDNEARARRPGIIGYYQGGMDDVQYFAVQVYREGESLPIFSNNTIPYRSDVSGEANQPLFSAAFTPGLRVEVIGKYIPYSARTTSWSERQLVVIPDIKLTELDIEIDAIRDDVLESVTELDQWTRYNVREEIERTREQILLAAEGQLGDYSARHLIQNKVSVQAERNKAELEESILLAAGPDSALAASVRELRAEVFDPDTGLPAVAESVTTLRLEVFNPDTGLEAVGARVDLLSVSYGDVSADGLFTVDVGIAPSGVSSRVVLSSRATVGGSTAAAAMLLDARSDGGVLTSEILLVGGRVSLVASTDPAATKRGLLVVEGDNVYIDNARIRNLTASNINVTTLSALSANMGNLTAGTISLGGGLFLIDGPNVRLVVSDG